MDELTLKEWLDLPCLPEEVKGNDVEGYYLALDTIREKLKYMQEKFSAKVDYSNFHHFLFNRMDKEVFASGSLEIEILVIEEYPYPRYRSYKKLVGAYSFNILDYDNEYEHNEQYAGTLKSLCIRNGLSEYPQFGSLLNNKELVRKINGRRPKPMQSHSAITKSLKHNG